MIKQIFQKLRPYGAFFIRVAFGIYLLQGSYQHLFDYEKMVAFGDFLELNGMPFSYLCAVITTTFQFTCGLLWILGYKVRLAGLLMAFNFSIAIFMVHLLNGHDYIEMAPALHLLAVSLFFVFHGAGKLSIDEGIRMEQ